MFRKFTTVAATLLFTLSLSSAAYAHCGQCAGDKNNDPCPAKCEGAKDKDACMKKCKEDHKKEHKKDEKK